MDVQDSISLIRDEAGQLVVLLGESGCGKTTTLKMINRLIESTCGTIEVEGEDTCFVDPTILRRSMGYVFQGIGLFPHMTVEQNVGLVPRLLGRSATGRKRNTQRLLELVGLPSNTFAHRFPEELSGGQQQRVGVARALAANPDYLLMDEPFGALDALSRELLQQELLSLKRKLEKTIVFVTHDIFEAFKVGTRIAIMDCGQIIQIGTPKEIAENPINDFIKKFVGKHLNALLIELETKKTA